MRETIDLGIDLGTTNSTIAKINGLTVDVYKNIEGSEYTSSAVWIDHKSGLHVGRRAKERCEDDPENAIQEFKLLMGEDQKFIFARNHLQMTPQQLSAEVLKSLKADVMSLTGEEITSAVITVPAAFKTNQIQATSEAAELAGLANCPILPEPIAAAMAYGFQTRKDNIYWLVYDFGGGTFDSAITKVKDGIIEIVNNDGDNHLGGKLLDWEIVNKIFLPAIVKQTGLDNFSRGNKQFSGAFAKLKSQAEIAKIRLSREESIEVVIDDLLINKDGSSYDFICEVKKSDFEEIALPFIMKSINICNRVLENARLKPKDIEKVLLVGGTSMMPFLRKTLSDSTVGLGIPLESGIYPITVVAQGAAIFAGTQRFLNKRPEMVKEDFFAELKYSPVGYDLEPIIGGTISSTGTSDYTGFSLEIINKTSLVEWRSGKILLNPEGKFFTQLIAEKDCKNLYVIELFDNKGVKRSIQPANFSYTYGIVNEAVPLTYAIGVALANNQTNVFFEQGTQISDTPVKTIKTLKSALSIKAGIASSILKIPFVEGASIKRADRNNLIGNIELSGNDITRSIPANSDIEITMEIDRSRLIKATVYIPIIDETLQKVLQSGKTSQTKQDLSESFEFEKKRIAEIKKNEVANDLASVDSLFKKIENENLLAEITVNLSTYDSDPESANKIVDRLLHLKIVLDEIEDLIAWPTLVKEANDLLDITEAQANGKFGNEKHKSLYVFNSSELIEALKSGDTIILKKSVGTMRELYISIRELDPGFWVNMLDYLITYKADMTNKEEAALALERGELAIKNNDIDTLKNVVNTLFRFLPSHRRSEAPGWGSTTI